MQMEELLWDDGDMDAVPGKYSSPCLMVEAPWGGSSTDTTWR